MAETNPYPKEYYAGGFLYNKKNDTILLHKRDKKTKINPSQWAFFGGLNNPGETPEETFIREIGEELSIKIPAENIISLCDYFNKELQTHRFVFYAYSQLSKSEMKLNEGEDFDWIPTAKIFDYELSEKTKKDLTYFLSLAK